MHVSLSRSERERLERYREAHGFSTLEEALIHAAGVELRKRYRLPATQAQVVPIQGLKSPKD